MNKTACSWANEMKVGFRNGSDGRDDVVMGGGLLCRDIHFRILEVDFIWPWA
jgi:hypothetical protein